MNSEFVFAGDSRRWAGILGREIGRARPQVAHPVADARQAVDGDESRNGGSPASLGTARETWNERTRIERFIAGDPSKREALRTEMSRSESDANGNRVSHPVERERTESAERKRVDSPQSEAIEANTEALIQNTAALRRATEAGPVPRTLDTLAAAVNLGGYFSLDMAIR